MKIEKGDLLFLLLGEKARMRAVDSYSDLV